ncbi:MAG: sensor domain-containing protein [Eubacteriales bacterium]
MNIFKKLTCFMHYKIKWICIVIALALLYISGVIFVVYTYETNMKETERNAISLAETAEAGISKSHLYALSSDNSDLGKPEYIELKSNLINVSKLNNNVRFAYILVQKEGTIYFTADSEPVDSADYSPPGQEFTEADELLYDAFKKSETTLTSPTTDRWGTWISVLVPMRDAQSGKIIAVFGVDYPAENWNHEAVSRTVQTGLVVLCLFVIFIILYFVFRQNKELRGEKAKLLESEIKLKESEALFRTIFDQATVGLALVCDDHFISAYKTYPSVNPQFEKIIGRTRDELTDLNWKDITHPDDLQLDTDKFTKFKAGIISGYSIEKRFIRPDGSAVWVHMSISPLYLGSNADIVHMCVIENICRRKEMEKILYDSERSKSVILSNIPGMAYRCRYDKTWTMEFISEGCYALTGYKPENLLHNKEITFNDLISSDYREYLWDKWTQAVEEKSKLTEEYEIVTASGDIKWVWEQGQGIYDDDGQVVALEGLIVDITDRKNHEIKLKHINYHDHLTNLYNRRYFETIIDRDLSDDPETKKAVLLVNIRKFTLLNITYGYVFCDNLIKELASELTLFTNEQCELFHISIDRFILYICEYEDKNELTDLCRSIIVMLNNLLTPKIVGANIGIVEIGENSLSAESIIKNASFAAESADLNQNFGYGFYNVHMAERVERKNVIKSELADAAFNPESNPLFMLYQPILDLKTNEVSGFEALARFRSEQFGVISPLEFIPIAEETKLIVPLGKQIMKLVCRTAKKFELQYPEPFIMSFNVSAIQLLREDFITDLKEAVKETGTDPGRLIMELTESVFSDNYSEINEIIDRIKELGIKISIDDFGTGYSSLARERELNADYLKIDKHFIDKLMDCAWDEAITGDIISIGHKLGHCVIAEGVEYEEQKEYLIQHNCDQMQGYLYSVPLAEDDALKFLQNKTTETDIIILKGIL